MSLGATSLWLLSLTVLFLSACAVAEDNGNDADSSPPPSSRELTWASIDVPPPGTDDPAAGRLLFLGRCTSCHGVDGRGDGPAARFMGSPPRDFADGLYKLRSRTGFPSGADLYRTISAGVVAAGMPSMAHLSSDERWMLVAEVLRLGRAGFVRDGLNDYTVELDLPEIPAFEATEVEVWLDGTVGHEWPSDVRAAADDEALVWLERDLAESLAELSDPGQAIDLGATPALTPALRAQGQALFNRWGCVHCHGEAGLGDGPASPTLTNARGGSIPALDLTSEAWIYKGGATVSDIARTLATGMAGTPMPSYRQGPESEAEIWALSHWVAILQRGEP